MRCRYKERAVFAGDSLEVDIYPEYRHAKSRSKKYKPTSEVQAKLNKKNQERVVTQYLNTNFTKKDYRLDLTYSPKHHPTSAEQAQKDMQNFIRRLKRYIKKNNLEELKYLYVTEIGKKGNKFHHHIVLNSVVTVSVLAEIWGKGYTTVKPLQPLAETNGLEPLAVYLLKKPIAGNAFSHSRNLKKPDDKKRVSRLSRKAIEWMKSYDDTTAIENLYPEYQLQKMTPYYNDVNGGYYFRCKFYKPQKPKPKRRNLKC